MSPTTHVTRGDSGCATSSAGEEDVIGLAHEGECGSVDIVSSGGGKQQSCGLGEFDSERADVDGLERSSEARLTRRAAPNLPDDPGVGHDLLFGLVCDGEACPHRSIVAVEGDALRTMKTKGRGCSRHR